MRGGHDCVVYDINPDAVRELAGEGAGASRNLEDFVAQLEQAARRLGHAAGRRGDRADGEWQLAELMEPGDIIIDGGNSYFKDDMRRAQALKPKGMHYVDVGTWGGVWGLERGYCMMIGGDKEVVDHLDPIFETLAPAAARSRARRAARAATRGPRGLSPLPARPAPAISSRWSTTASSTA